MFNFLRSFLPKSKPQAIPRKAPARNRRAFGFSGSLTHAGIRGNSYFEALDDNGARTQIAIRHPGVETTAPERLALSGIARSLYDNGGYAAYAVDQIALYSAPLYPQAASSDDAWNDKAEAYFSQWSRRCDFQMRSTVDFAALQTMACNGIDLDGDAGFVMTGENGAPQLQFVEGWRIGTWRDDERIRDGVKVDRKGRVVGYCVGDSEGSEMVGADSFILLRDPSVTSPYRGQSPFRRGANSVRDHDDIIGFEKTAVKTNSGLVGLIESQEGMEEKHGFQAQTEEEVVDVAAKSELDASTDTEKAISRADILGGDIPVLENGQKWVKAESNRPNAQFSEFLDSLTSIFAAGLGIPPAFFLDKQLTGPNTRSVLGKAQRKFSARQAVLAGFVEWVWVRVIADAIESGELEAVEDWDKVTIQTPSKLTIDAGREAQQDRDDESKGLLTRQDHYGARGKDWQRATTQKFKEERFIIQQAKELAKSEGVDVSMILARFGYEPKPPAPAAPAANTKDQKAKP